MKDDFWLMVLRTPLLWFVYGDLSGWMACSQSAVLLAFWGVMTLAIIALSFQVLYRDRQPP